jgi:hypothetical protein
MAYRVKIVRGDGQCEFEGDKKFVLDMLAKYGDVAEAPPKVPEKPAQGQKAVTPQPVLPSSGKKIGAGEFIRQLGFKKHTDMVLAFGYYLEKMSGLASFTGADINACYYDAKLESSNTSQMIIRNIHAGRIMPAKKASEKGKRTSYVLTRTGEEFIEKKPSKPAK